MKYNKTIGRFISYQFENCVRKVSERYPDSIFWVIDKEVIVEIEKSEHFWVKRRIWDNIQNMFSLEYFDTQRVIKEWLEEQDKLGELTPSKLKVNT